MSQHEYGKVCIYFLLKNVYLPDRKFTEFNMHVANVEKPFTGNCDDGATPLPLLTQETTTKSENYEKTLIYSKMYHKNNAQVGFYYLRLWTLRK